MKHTSIILLLIATTLIYGCSKSDAPTQPVPLGTFSGNFTRIHLNPKTNKLDTAKAVITLATGTNGLFKVSGDTSKIHAGSHGVFAVSTAYMQFADSTATVINPPKIHLTGIYQYYYDGSVFQLGASNDTLKVLYDLKKN